MNTCVKKYFILRFTAFLIILSFMTGHSFMIFAVGEITDNTVVSTVVNNNRSGSTQHSGKGVVSTDGDTLNYTYTNEVITSPVILYDYISDDEKAGNTPNSIASGYADPYTQFNTAVSNDGSGTEKWSDSEDNITFRFKTKVNGLTKAYIYVFDDNGNSTGWADHPMVYDNDSKEYRYTFRYNSLGFTPTKFIIWGDSSYGEWQTDDISHTLEKGKSYLYDDVKEVNGTANRISISIPIANSRVTAVGGINKRDQNLHLRKKSSGNVQVNMYGGFSGQVNMTQSGTNWVANSMNVSSATGDITVSIRSDGYLDNSGTAQTGYYAETVPFVITKGHNYTFNDWNNLTEGTALDLYRPVNRFKAPLYFGCFYRGDSNDDYTAFNKPDYANFYWSANMSQRGNVNASVQKLVDPELDNNHQLTQDGEVLPYFDSSWVSEDVSRAGLMQTYDDLYFPFYGIKASASNIRGHEDGDTGYAKFYQFNSRETNVVYDEDTDCIKETSTSIHSQGTQSDANGTIGFYPFNTTDNNTQLNLGFGARFDISFKLRSDGKVETVDANGVGTGKYVDAMFEFVGDDDVWVYIDDKLILDLGGDHKDTTGIIDFAARKAYANNALEYTDANRDLLNSSSSAQEVDLNTAMKTGTFKDGVYNDEMPHMLTMFYMERGMFESDLLIRYNFAVLSNTNIFKIREITKFSNVNAGLRDAAKKAADHDVFQYQVYNDSDENGSPSGILTPVYDTYTRTNQGLSARLSGQTKEKAVYLDTTGLWDERRGNFGAWIWREGENGYDNAHGIYASTKIGTNLYKFTGFPDDANRIVFLFPSKNTTFSDGQGWSGIQNQSRPTPSTGYEFNIGDRFVMFGTNYDGNNSRLDRNIFYEANNYIYNASDSNHYVNTVNYLWTDEFSAKTDGSDGDSLAGTTSNTGILSLMYGTSETESSAEFRNQFKRLSNMRVIQLDSLKTPAYNSSNETFTNTLSRSIDEYYTKSVTAYDRVGTELSMNENGSFVYKNSDGVPVKDAVQITEVFENEPKLGAVTITKQLAHGDTVTDNFKMRLELKDIFGVENINITDYSAVEANVDIDEDGYFYIRVGQTVVINNIPYGTYYRITEADSTSKYSMTSNTNTGYEQVYQGIVNNNLSSHGNNNEQIVNTRLVNSLHLTKTITGEYAPADASDGFIYNVVLNGPSGVDLSAYGISGVNLGTYDNINNRYSFTVTLHGGDDIEITGIPYGTTYNVSESSLTNWQIQSSSGLSGEILGDTYNAHYTNVYDNYGDLMISKTVSPVNGYIDTNTSFVFTVTLTDRNSQALTGTTVYTAEKNGNTDNITFVNGVATVNLKHNDVYTIKHVLDGYHFSISEGASLQFNAVASQSGIITGHSTVSKSFTNTRNTCDVVITKLLDMDREDITPYLNDEFEFTVSLTGINDGRRYSDYKIWYRGDTQSIAYFTGADGQSDTVNFTVNLKHNESAVIKDLPVNATVLISEGNYARFVSSYTITGDNPQASNQANTERDTVLAMNTAEIINFDEDEIVIVFTNSYVPSVDFNYVLPATGLTAEWIYMIVFSILITGCVGVYMYFSYRYRHSDD